MRKLLQINSVVNWGSTGKIVEGIAEKAIENGWESYIAYGRSKGYENESTSKLIRISNDFDVRLHGLLTRLTDAHGLGSVRATRQLIRQIDNIQPDIIHLHNIHGYYINIKILFSYLALSQIPIVWTLHDCWALTGHCSYFDFIKCNKWQKYCHDCILKGSYPTSLFIDRSKENFSLKKELFNSLCESIIVPVSDWLARIVEKSLLNKYPLQVIHNGIDCTIFTDKITIDEDIKLKYSIPKEKFIILGVANLWDDRKGLKDFIELSKKLDNNICIILVGLSSSQKKNLPHCIIGIERTQSVKDLAALYRLADLFINLTWEDNFPTTNIEALACGTPVLTYNTGGSIEAVNSQTGFIVPQGDLSAVVKCIEQVRQQSKAFYRRSCRERALMYYDKNKQFDKYIKLYNKCLETKSY